MILMSNNQWKCDWNNDTWRGRGEDCSAEGRVGGLVRAYTEIMPDLLGLQEVSVHMAELMMERMEYVETADGGKARYEYISGGDTPIVYRSDKLKLLESGFFRYTEEIDGLEGSFNNGETKSYSWGVFERRDNGALISFMSTHLWWKSVNPDCSWYQKDSDKARAYQISQACERMNRVMAEYSCPGMIVGDFNDGMDSPCLRAAYADGWVDVHDIVSGECDETRGHHHCGGDGWSRGDAGVFRDAIDHMIVKNADGYEFCDMKRVNDCWFDPISDHYPVYVTMNARQ